MWRAEEDKFSVPYAGLAGAFQPGTPEWPKDAQKKLKCFGLEAKVT